MYKGFPLEQVAGLSCHRCTGSLEVVKKKTIGSKLVSGHLTCSTCKTNYPVKHGIVNVLEAQGELDDTSKQEIHSRDEEADIYDEAFCTPEGNLMEISPTLEHLGPVEGKRLLELGCGTGRITLELASCAHSILAVDYSYGSLVNFAGKCPENANVGLVCADITQVKFPNGYYDGAVSAQVLQHLRGLETRQRFYMAVRDALRIGSVFVLSAYHYDLKKRIRRERKEGYHKSEIFYHSFTLRELKQELSPFFDVDEAHPIEIRVPLAHRLFTDLVRLSRNLEHIPLVNQFGEWVIAKGIKPDM